MPLKRIDRVSRAPAPALALRAPELAMNGEPTTLHLAIIMDGNGRWAAERGWPRSRGHRAGADAVERVVRAAPQLGVGTVTLYAFSADNWSRPPAEVRTLMTLFGRFLRTRTASCVRDGVRLSVIGRRDRLPAALVEAIAGAEQATREGGRVHLRLAVDYSARDAILRAAATAAGRRLSREGFRELLARATPSRRRPTSTC